MQLLCGRLHGLVSELIVHSAQPLLRSVGGRGQLFGAVAEIAVNGGPDVKGVPSEVTRMDTDKAPNRASEKPVQESFSSPGAEWEVNGTGRKPRNPANKVCTFVRLSIPCLFWLRCFGSGSQQYQLL